MPNYKNKILFTPGPLSTSETVKLAMLSDLGSRDEEFQEIILDIEKRLLLLANLSPTDYAAILMQGSGTFGLESVIGTAIPKDGSLLVIENGAYGKRLAQIALTLKIPVQIINFREQDNFCLKIIKEKIENSDATHIAMVHCETSTGMFNPVLEVSKISKNNKKVFICDAMSSFGAVPIDFTYIDYLISSANKCIEGVPGFSFVIANKKDLINLEGQARSLSLDLYNQWRSLVTNKQFRFTPPTHAFLAFRQALIELFLEGGIEGRAQRYKENYEIIFSGMKKLGFLEFLPKDKQGYIITSFRYPKNNFDFQVFYQKLNNRGFVIYPGKVGEAECFRIGNIGHIFKTNMHDLLSAISEVKQEMKF
jgi:2-aminoethylphosphonate-pyruvate transaminase